MFCLLIILPCCALEKTWRNFWIRLKRNLKIANDGLKSNKLSLNLKKLTKITVFGYRKITNQPQIKINNVEIERVYGNQFLGVITDH